MELQPEMMSYAFNVHDEFFQPDPAYPANEMYALHPRDELETFCRAAQEHGVKTEIECFYTGAYWNLRVHPPPRPARRPGLGDDLPRLAGRRLDAAHAGCAALHGHHLPRDVNWNLSVMDSATQWQLHARRSRIGGHVRVGWEDNPYLPDGTLARSNADLVEVVVRMARVDRPGGRDPRGGPADHRPSRPVRGCRGRMTLFGAWSALPSAEATEALALRRRRLRGRRRSARGPRVPGHRRRDPASRLLGVESLVRISELELELIPRFLDFGAGGVIVAMVDDAKRRRRVVSLARYQPVGLRSYGGRRYGLSAEPDSLRTMSGRPST